MCLYLCLPYITTLLLCFFSAIIFLHLNNQRYIKPINYIVIAVSLITISCFIASKTDANIIGNDRYQYFNYIHSFTLGSFFEVIKIQPEIFSFGLLNVLAVFLGISNWVFYFFFLISFSILLLGVIRLDYKILPLFILTFLCTTAFYVLYGNIIRQGLAASFLVLAYFSKGNSRNILTISMLFSHSAFLSFIPILFFEKKISNYINNNKWYLIVVIFIACNILTFIFPYFFEMLSHIGIESFKKKVELYINWEVYDVFGARISFLIIACLTFFLNYLDEKTNIFDRDYQQDRKKIALAVNYILCLVALVSSNAVIFNRFYSVLLLFFILYFWFCIFCLKYKNIKNYIIIASAASLLILNMLSISKHKLYYNDNPLNILHDNIFILFSMF